MSVGFYRLTKLLVLLLSFAGLLGGAADVGAAACVSAATGNWNAAATWTAGSACTLAGGNTQDGPDANDTVTISNGHVITVTLAGGARAAASIVMNGGATTTTLNLLNDLAVGGDVTINAPTSNAVIKQITVGTRTFTVGGNVTLNGGTTGGTNANRTTQLTVTSGTVTIGTVGTPKTLNITGDASANAQTSIAQVTVTTGLITVNGDVNVTGGGTAAHDALLSVTSASAGANGVLITGALNVNSTFGGSAIVSITAANGVITTQGTVTNRDTISLTAAGTFNAEGDVTVQANTNAVLAQLTVTSGTLNVGTLATPRDLFITAGATNRDATVSVGTGTINVRGNVTLQGGAAATHDALLSVTGASASTGLTIDGNLTVNATVGGSATVSITNAGGIITVKGTVTNGDTISVATATFNTEGDVTVQASTDAVLAQLTVTTGTLNVGTLATPRDLFITAGATNRDATVSVTTGTINVRGNVTLQGGAAATDDALLTVTAASASTGLTIDGNLTVNATVGGSATVSITNAGGIITVKGTVTNGDTISVATATFNTEGDVTVQASTDAVLAQLTVTTGTLNVGTLATPRDLFITAGATNRDATVSVTTGTINVRGNVTLQGGAAATDDALLTVTAASASTGLTIDGNLTVNATVGGSATVSNTNAGGIITVQGTVTNGDSISVSGTFNANGDFASSGTFTSGAAGQLNLRGATSTINGTFTRSTGTVTMNGSAAQNLTGSALTPIAAGTGLNNLTIDNANGVTIGSTVSVNATTTFTTGNITTGGNTLIAVPNCATSVSRTSGHVEGNLRKTIPAGASSCTFEIGSGANYAPAVLAFVAGTTAGNITASTTGSEHGSIGSSAINSAKSVNRYWTLTNGGVTVPAAGFTATFNFINGSPVDFDSGADPTKFLVQRFSGGWTTPTLNAGCTATPGTNLCEQVNGLTVAAGFGDFAIGEATYSGGNAGWFNVFETVTGVGIAGNIYTKKINDPISLDVVAVNATRTGVNTGYSTNPITVDLLNASDNSGALTAETDCRSSWTAVGSAQSLSPTWTSGRATISVTVQTNVLKEARIRVTQGNLIGCSTDNFTIRPGDFAVSSTNATNSGTSGTPTFRAGSDSFNLTATSVAGYNGSPSVDNTASMVVGTPNQGTIGGSFGAAPIGTGIATGAGFTYTEVGNFGLAANAVFDSSFVVDTAPGDCTNDFSSNLVGGKYGCKIGSAAVAVGSGFGRFIPDNFGVSYNAPTFTTGCGTFSYVGKTFSYGTAPVITVTARNSSNAATTNYSSVTAGGAYMKLSNAAGVSLNQAPYNTQAGRYTRFDALGGGTTPALDLAGLPATTADPAIGSFVNGVGTLTFSSGSGLGFVRSTTTPNAPFNADIALVLNVIDDDGVAFASNPAAFGAATSGNGMAFSGGKGMRFGRLRILNATGPATVDLTVPIQTEFWNGTAFALNANDSCTTLTRANITLGGYAKNLAACETIVSTDPVNFSGGQGTLKLSAPGATNDGSLNLTPQLGNTFSGKYCTAVGGAGNEADPTPAQKSYLQGAWPGPNYDQNPTARGAFGTFGAQPRQFIFFRENY